MGPERRGRVVRAWLAVNRLRTLAQPSAQAAETVLQCPPLEGDAMKPALAAGDAGLALDLMRTAVHAKGVSRHSRMLHLTTASENPG